MCDPVTAAVVVGALGAAALSQKPDSPKMPAPPAAGPDKAKTAQVAADLQKKKAKGAQGYLGSILTTGQLGSAPTATVPVMGQ